jgi:hypothetical protein
VIVAGNRQYLIRANDPYYLKYMMLLDADCSGNRARKRTANI